MRYSQGNNQNDQGTVENYSTWQNEGDLEFK